MGCRSDFSLGPGALSGGEELEWGAGSSQRASRSQLSLIVRSFSQYFTGKGIILISGDSKGALRHVVIL